MGRSRGHGGKNGRNGRHHGQRTGHSKAQSPPPGSPALELRLIAEPEFHEAVSGRGRSLHVSDEYTRIEHICWYVTVKPDLWRISWVALRYNAFMRLMKASTVLKWCHSPLGPSQIKTPSTCIGIVGYNSSHLCIRQRRRKTRALQVAWHPRLPLPACCPRGLLPLKVLQVLLLLYKPDCALAGCPATFLEDDGTDSPGLQLSLVRYCALVCTALYYCVSLLTDTASSLERFRLRRQNGAIWTCCLVGTRQELRRTALHTSLFLASCKRSTEKKFIGTSFTPCNRAS